MDHTDTMVVHAGDTGGMRGMDRNARGGVQGTKRILYPSKQNRQDDLKKKILLSFYL